MSPGNNLLSKAHWKYNTYVVNNVCGKVFWPEHSALLRQVQFKFLQVVKGKKWDITLCNDHSSLIHFPYHFLSCAPEYLCIFCAVFVYSVFMYLCRVQVQRVRQLVRGGRSTFLSGLPSQPVNSRLESHHQMYFYIHISKSKCIKIQLLATSHIHIIYLQPINSLLSHTLLIKCISSSRGKSAPSYTPNTNTTSVSFVRRLSPM